MISEIIAALLYQKKEATRFFTSDGFLFETNIT